MNMVDKVVATIATWAGISVEPHRFGGQEFKLGNVEIGHIHRHGMVDIPFTRTIREQLVKEGRAEPHHLLADSGWITFYMRSEADIDHALWLYRLSYVQKGMRRRPDLDWNQVELPLSDEMNKIIFKES